MKLILIPALLFFGVQSFAGVQDASSQNLQREPKATICYEEASAYARTIASDAHATIRGSKLTMFTNIGDVQVEGWSFKTSRAATIVVIASADGVEGSLCNMNLAYNQ